MTVPFRVRDLTEDECVAIARWLYDGRYETYGFGEGRPSAELGYLAVVDRSDDLVGYCCFGAEARVPGVDAEEGVVDVGYGMRPDLTGQGLGRPFVVAILAFARSSWRPQRFRAQVLDWNTRSQTACGNAGFEKTGAVSSNGRTFVILERNGTDDD